MKRCRECKKIVWPWHTHIKCRQKREHKELIRYLDDLQERWDKILHSDAHPYDLAVETVKLSKETQQVISQEIFGQEYKQTLFDQKDNEA